MLGHAKRIHDKQIYLHEDRFDQPKEYFKLIAQYLAAHKPAFNSLLDVGCATGELLYYLQSQFHRANILDGMDIVEDFFATAKQHNPQSQFFISDIEQAGFSHQQQYDVVTCCGVMTCIFDIETALHNLCSLIKPAGYLLIFSAFNEENIDLHAYYRRADSNTDWETGKNIYSLYTMNQLINQHAKKIDIIDFNIPFPIQKTNDPLRSWTEPFRDNPNHLIYGTGQFVTAKLIAAQF